MMLEFLLWTALYLKQKRKTYYSIEHHYKTKISGRTRERHVDPEGLWWWCVTLGITGFLDVVHRRYSNEHNVSKTGSVRTGTDSVSETLRIICSSGYRTMDTVKKQYSRRKRYFKISDIMAVQLQTILEAALHRRYLPAGHIMNNLPIKASHPQ
jgi:hypothetical protein